MKIISFGLSDINYDQIKYVVMISKYKEKFVVIKNKSRDLWELPGGKREVGETLLQAASRELFEETGALRFELIPYGIYLMNGSFGMNFYVTIEEIGPLPNYEIEKIKYCDELPDQLGYGKIYYKMNEEWNEKVDKRKLRKYSINYFEKQNTFEF